MQRIGQVSWRRHRLKLGFVAVAAAGIAVWASTFFVLAVPHTIGPRPHPYDPLWLEVRWVLAQKCAACHRSGSELSDLSNYAALMAARGEDGAPLVVPGRPDESIVWQSVAWNAREDAESDLPEEPSMPADPHEWLTAGQLDLLHRWISGGALEYKLPSTCSPRPLLEIDFPSAKECQICHPKQFEEWSRSMHAYAQHSPVFEAFNLTLLERTSGTIGTFCSRCHTPLGTALGENGSRRNVHRSRISMEGVSCIVCHRMKKPYYKSNARQAIQGGALLEGCMYGPFHDSKSLEMGAHQAQGRPFIKTSAFCGTCHDVTSPAGVRLEEAFSEWQNSPAAKRGVTCQNCHMGPVQGVPIADRHRPLGRAATVPGVDPQRIPLRRLSDHTFAGPDYSLLPNTEFPHKLDWMYEVDYRDPRRLTAYQRKTLDELRRKNRKQLRIADEKRYELLHNAAELEVCAPLAVVAGHPIKIRAVVRSKFSGHNFPTGFTAERQAWVSVVLRDSQGGIVFVSGDFDPNGDLRDEHSHFVEAGKIPFDKHLFNFQSKFVALTNKGTERSLVLPISRHLDPLSLIRPATDVVASYGRPHSFRLSKSSLAPLSKAGRSYSIPMPQKPGPYFLEVRLNFRHLPPALLDRIGTPHLKHLLETVVIDEHSQVIRVLPAGQHKFPLFGAPK